MVAKAVNAPKYDEVPVLTCGYFGYWEGVPRKGGGGEIYSRGKRTIGCWPTNDSKTMIYVGAPISEFDTIRKDVEGSFMATLELVPDLAERVRKGKRTEPIYGSGDLPNFYRKPYGPGWALVGDAGFIKDPLSAHGIHDAFLDAERLAEALDAGFSGKQPLEAALANHEQKRNAETKAAYDNIIDIARMNPPRPEQIALFRALSHNPVAAKQFFGAIIGITDPAEFFTPANLFKIIGVRGMAKIMLDRAFHPAQRAS
jgi:2-polyprenyl-6-methoxyphenol hydroxylase-like FAD-dependent oxidoreductase